MPDARIESLDAFRGFAIAAMMLVNNPGDWDHVYAPLLHAQWHGWTFTDTIFPFFLFICGVAMPLAIAKARALGGGDAAVVRRFAVRAAIIFAAGLALNFIPAFDPQTVRIPGVLQRIALCIAIAIPLLVRANAARAAALAIVALLGAYALAELCVPVPGADGVVAAGSLEPGRDAGAYVDRMLLGGHLWSKSKTWDPEGLLSTLPAACSLLLGALAGLRLRRGLPARRVESELVIAGIVSLAVGVALDAWLMPINKNLWTPSYVLLMNGYALVAFAAAHWLLDGERAASSRAAARRLLLPLTIFGMNALFLFVLSGLVGRALVAIVVPQPDGAAVPLKALVYAPFVALTSDPHVASLLFAVAFLLAMFAVAWIMWRRRWFVRA
jgi:predicted acyltransferase